MRGCTAGFIFICNIIFRLCHCIPCLMLILLSWRTTMSYNYLDCWTCFQEEIYPPVTILLKCYFNYYLSYTPNTSWVWENLIWLIHTYEPYHCLKWKICAYKQPSRDEMDTQVRMALVFHHQVFLWMNSELDLGNLLMYAWAQFVLCCNCLLQWNK